MPRSKKTVAEILQEKKVRQLKKDKPKKSDKVKKIKPKKPEKPQNQLLKHSEIKGWKKIDEYLLFIDFMATPKAYRKIETMDEFGKKYGVHRDTLTDWKNRKGFWLDVREARKKYIREEMLGDALLSLKRSVLKDGKAPEVKLLFQLADEYEEKSVVENRRPTTLTDQQKIDIAKRLKKWQGKS